MSEKAKPAKPSTQHEERWSFQLRKPQTEEEIESWRFHEGRQKVSDAR